jgi:pimeloyl-ACP methyl ester carboxylesterase
MDLVLIHGRAQEGRKTEAILKQWLEGLRESFQIAGLAFPSFGEIRLPYYGDKLAELTYNQPATTASIAHKGLQPGESFDPFVAEFVKQMARRDGLTEQQVMDVLTAEGLTVVQKGPKEWAWVHALARHLEAKHPWLRDRVLEHIVADVEAYVERPDVRDAVHTIVQPAIGSGPCVVIAHSLGTVVAYWILAKNLRERTSVPLLITAGSPLGLTSIKTAIVPPPRNFPDGVGKWVNFTDKRDIVALSETLDAQTFLDNIDNITDLHNGDDPHSITRYLADPRVAKSIHSALAAAG